MKLLFKYLFSLIFFVGIVVNGFSQMILDTLLLSELEILATKTNYDKTIKRTSIDTLVKQEFNNLNLGEILGIYTPVFVKTYGRGALASVSFRGTSASHTQVYWDDFVINSPMLGQVDFSQIPTSFVDEVELYYGGGSLIKANGALGGGVALINSAGFSGLPMVSVEQSLGSFGFVSTSAGLNLGNEKFRSTTRFSYQSANNEFPYLNTTTIPAQETTQQDADFQNTGFTQQFSFRPTQNHLITINSWNQWNNRNIPTLMTNVENGIKQVEKQKDIFSRNSVSWIYYQNNSKLELKGAYFFSDMNYLLTSAEEGNSDLDTTIDSQNRTNTFSGKIKYSHSFKKGISIAAGFDLDVEEVNSNNYEAIKRRNTASLFAMVVKDFKRRLELSLLIRGVIVDGRLLPVMPQFGVSYKIIKSEEFYLRASVSRNYHLPTLNDLYWNPGGNEDLKPEDGIEAEGGISYTKSFLINFRIEADLSIFASNITDWIQWVPSEYGYWSSQNMNEVFARGVESSLGFSGAKGRFNYKFLSQYSYTKTSNESEHAKNEGFSGRQLIYIPVHSGSGFIYSSYHGYFINWTLSYVGERNTSLNPDTDHFSTMPAYMLNNLSIGKKFYWKRTLLGLRFSVNNIFNENYQAILWRAMPGRNYEVVLKFELNHKK